MRFFALALALHALLVSQTPSQATISPLAEIGQQGQAVALRPDGQFCAVASGLTISIIDLRGLPTGPFPVMTSFTVRYTVRDMDWGPPGIMAVGERASITFIEEAAGPSWNLRYALDHVLPYDTAEFCGVAVVSTSVAVVGGKPNPNIAPLSPSLFQWGIQTQALGLTYLTDNEFGQNGWIKTVAFAPMHDRIAAGSRNSSKGAVVAIYPLSSSNSCYHKVLTSQVDNVMSVSFPPDETYLLTAGSPRGTAYVGCNDRLLYGGCSLGVVLEIGSMAAQYCLGTAAISFRGRPLGAICSASRIAFVYLDDGTEPFFNDTGADDLDGSEARHLILDSKGRVFSFDMPVLSVTNAVAGQVADLRVDFASPGGVVVAAWSTVGDSPTTLPGGSCGSITVNLSQPVHKVFPYAVAGADGVAVQAVNVPAGASGVEAWVQAVDVVSCRATNVVHVTVG